LITTFASGQELCYVVSFVQPVLSLHFKDVIIMFLLQFFRYFLKDIKISL